MQKFITDILQIAIVVRMGYTILRWGLKGIVSRGRKRSIAGKIMLLISNRIHYRLDNALKKQRTAFKQPVTKNNVIHLRETR